MMKKILEGKKIKNKFSFVWADSKMLTKPLHVSVPYHFVFLGEVLNYIEKMINNEIDVFDFESGDTEFYKFINNISTNNYSAIAFFVSPDNIENTLTLLKYIKTISPETKCIAYGELCVFLQDYFKSTTFDAIVSDRCDSEVAIFDFFMYAEKKKNKNELRGVKFIENGELKLSTKGEFIPGKEWGFTDINKPFVKELFGIEGKKQVTIEIARGCPYDCMYCKEVSFSGTIERRRPIEKIIKYINSINCDRFKFYASNFTLDEEYAIELCEKLIKNPKKIKWSCTTRPDLLKNEVLIEKMAEAGCEKISVGIETAEIDELISLNRNYNTNVIIQGIKMLNKYNITYKATDFANNSSTKDITLTVEAKPKSTPTNPQIKRVDFTTSKGFNAYIENGLTYIDGVLVVNKTYSLPQNYGNGLTKETQSAFNDMKAAALTDGISLWICSGFRSYNTQKNLYNSYVNRDGKAKADTYSARAGYSEHQSGLAMDINMASSSFNGSNEAIWLSNNAYKYGFILRYPDGKTNETGYKFESWHYRYVGVDLATKLYNDGDWITLEDYFGITSEYSD